jgi:hypothetical protein
MEIEHPLHLTHDPLHGGIEKYQTGCDRQQDDGDDI